MGAQLSGAKRDEDLDDQIEDLDEDDDLEDDDEEQDDDEKSESKGKKSGEKLDPKDHKIQQLTESRGRIAAKRDALKADVARLTSELDAEKAKNSTDPEALNAANATIEQHTTTIGKLQVENALLRNTTHTWVDPTAVLRLVDLSGVEFNDDGTVDGLDEALDDLAAKSPYLLAPKGQADDDDDDDEPKPRRSGDKTTSRQKNSKASKAADKARLLAKYPGLKR